MRPDLPSGTVTFLFTDIEGSSRHLAALGPGPYAAALADHRRIIRAACHEHGGVEVDTQGDAFFFAFATAAGAVAAAASFTDGLTKGPIRVRVGVHTGSPLLTDEGYVGHDVHVAARVAAAAHGGQVVLTAATAELVGSGPTLTALGEHRLKDVPAPIAIMQLGSTTFPPLRSIANTNLPRPSSTFVGRAHEVDAVRATIADGARLVTLSGPGGTGKTRLAIEAARGLLASYKAGVFWVPLASLRDPTLVLDTIATTIGAREPLTAHVGDREMLLVLDNLEQVVAAGPDLAGVLEACPRLAMLVTSRELLGVRGEVEFPVPPLAGSDAIDLFCARSGLAPSPAIARLCASLDDLPLAIELAAARTRALSVEQILARLSSRLDLLKGGRDVDPRHQTLRATIEWSYDLLSAAERRLFRSLAVFVGGCTLDAAEQIAGADVDLLQSLIEKSLVRRGLDRYRMLETVREFAADRLDAAGEAPAVRLAHARWFAAFIDQAEPMLEGPEQGRWLDRIGDEIDNIRAALAFATGDLKLRIAGSMATFWWVRGQWTEGRAWLEGAVTATGPQEDALRAIALEGLAHLAMRQLDVASSTGPAEESLAIRRRLGDPRGIARSLRVLGLIASVEGDATRFRQLTEESASYARSAGDLWALSMALNNLGYIALTHRDAGRSVPLFEEAIAVARARGDDRSEAFFLENLAFAKLEAPGGGDALGDLVASLGLAHRLGFIEVEATNLVGLARIAAAHGEGRSAALLVGGADMLLRETGGRFDPVEDRVRTETLAVLQDQLESAALDASIDEGGRLDADRLYELGMAVAAAASVAGDAPPPRLGGGASSSSPGDGQARPRSGP